MTVSTDYLNANVNFNTSLQKELTYFEHKEVNLWSSDWIHLLNWHSDSNMVAMTNRCSVDLS